MCDSLEKDNLSIDKLKKLIDEAIEVGVKLFVLVGKEPLLDIKRTKELLDYLGKRKVKFGMVTNGTLIERNIDQLRNYGFYYFDVSVDGTEEYHDLTRGKGTFSKAKEGIELIMDNKLTNKLFISSVLMSYNYRNIPEMIKGFNKIGIKNFSLGVYIHTGLNPKEWILEKEQLVELIDSLKKLDLDVEQIIIDIHTQVNHYWDYLIEKGVIDEDKISIDSHNNVFFQIPTTKIFLKNSMFTTNFWNTAIVTADGYYLDDYEYLANQSYKEIALGNVKNDSFRELLKRVEERSPERFLTKIKKYM